MGATRFFRFLKSNRAAALLVAGVVAVDLLALLATGYFLVDSRAGYEARAATSTQALARVLQQSIDSEVRRIDLTLQVAVDELQGAARAGGVAQDGALPGFFARLGARLAPGSALRASDAAGRVILGTDVGPTTRVDWAARPFFQGLRDGARRGLWVTNPIIGAFSHQPVIAFVRRYDDAQGHFAGVVEVALPVSHLTRLLQQAVVGRSGLALLRDASNALITRMPPSTNPNERLGKRHFSPQLHEAIASGRSTVTFFAAHTGDGIPRVDTYRRLSALPFSLVVGRAQADFLRPWRRQRDWGIGFLGAFLCVSGVGAWRLLREMRRSDRVSWQAQGLLRNASDGLHVLDAEGRLVLVSDEFCAMLGYPREELLGKHASFWDVAMSAPELQVKIAEQMDTPTRSQFQTLHRRKDGSVFAVEISGKPLDIQGTRLLFNSSRDITEREAARRDIAQALEALRESQEIAGIGSYELDIRRGVWSSSAVLDRLLGIAPGDEHTVASWIALIAPEDRDAMARYFEHEVLGDGNMFDREYRIVRPADGALRWVHGRGRLVFDTRGRPRSMRGTIQDVTERVRAQQTLRESEERFRALVEQSLVAIYIIQDGRLRYVNPGFARMFGFTSTAEISERMPVDDLVSPADRDLVREQIARRISGEVASAHFQFTALRKDGSPMAMEVYGGAFLYHGRPAVLGIGMDVSERSRAEQDLRIAAAAFESQDGIIVTDAAGVIQRVNRAFTRITGYDEADAIGRTPAFLHSGSQDAEYYTQMWASVTRNGSWQGELVNQRKDGSLFTERLAISAVTDAQGTVTHYVGSFSDVTRQREAESRAERLAYFDALTDLPNRTLLYDRLEHALSRSARNQEYCALLFVDLDNFKRVNDTIGHHAGDQLLVRVAQRMLLAVRETDTVARFGGDEFVVVLEDLGGDAPAAAAHASVVAEKLRLGMAEAYDIGDQPFYSSVSIGATLFRGGADSARDILMHADLAMYRAKQDGRNALRFFEQGMEVELAARTALESELRVAIARQQFVLYFQPQLDRDGRAIGAEALLRWHHPTRGLLSPGAFMELAEETGIIVPLGQWVLDAACARIAAWADAPCTRHLVLAMNASARQFAQTDFVDCVLGALRRAGADPSRLKIELTESTVLDNVSDAFEKMRALKASGISFSLDDFGTGSSSLSYLTRLPLDQLKIDKSFVDDLPQDAQDAMVAQTIIAMGKGLGLNVVAEGVETEAQWEFLMQHGCDAFQGFRFGRPMPVAEFEALLRAGDVTPRDAPSATARADGS